MKPTKKPTSKELEEHGIDFILKKTFSLAHLKQVFQVI